MGAQGIQTAGSRNAPDGRYDDASDGVPASATRLSIPTKYAVVDKEAELELLHAHADAATFARSRNLAHGPTVHDDAAVGKVVRKRSEEADPQHGEDPQSHRFIWTIDDPTTHLYTWGFAASPPFVAAGVLWHLAVRAIGGGGSTATADGPGSSSSETTTTTTTWLSLELHATLSEEWQRDESVRAYGNFDLPYAPDGARWRQTLRDGFEAAFSRDDSGITFRNALNCRRLGESMRGDRLAVQVEFFAVLHDWRADSSHMEARYARAAEQHGMTVAMADALGVRHGLYGMSAAIRRDAASGDLSVQYSRGAFVADSGIKLLSVLLLDNMMCHYGGDGRRAMQQLPQVFDVLHAKQAGEHVLLDEYGRDVSYLLTPCSGKSSSWHGPTGSLRSDMRGDRGDGGGDGGGDGDGAVGESEGSFWDVTTTTAVITTTTTAAATGVAPKSIADLDGDSRGAVANGVNGESDCEDYDDGYGSDADGDDDDGDDATEDSLELLLQRVTELTGLVNFEALFVQLLNVITVVGFGKGVRWVLSSGAVFPLLTLVYCSGVRRSWRRLGAWRGGRTAARATIAAEVIAATRPPPQQTVSNSAGCVGGVGGAQLRRSASTGSSSSNNRGGGSGGGGAAQLQRSANRGGAGGGGGGAGTASSSAAGAAAAARKEAAPPRSRSGRSRGAHGRGPRRDSSAAQRPPNGRSGPPPHSAPSAAAATATAASDAATAVGSFFSLRSSRFGYVIDLPADLVTAAAAATTTATATRGSAAAAASASDDGQVSRTPTYSLRLRVFLYFLVVFFARLLLPPWVAHLTVLAVWVTEAAGAPAASFATGLRDAGRWVGRQRGTVASGDERASSELDCVSRNEASAGAGAGSDSVDGSAAAPASEPLLSRANSASLPSVPTSPRSPRFATLPLVAAFAAALSDAANGFAGQLAATAANEAGGDDAWAGDGDLGGGDGVSGAVAAAASSEALPTGSDDSVAAAPRVAEQQPPQQQQQQSQHRPQRAGDRAAAWQHPHHRHHRQQQQQDRQHQQQVVQQAVHQRQTSVSDPNLDLQPALDQTTGAHRSQGAMAALMRCSGGGGGGGGAQQKPKPPAAVAAPASVCAASGDGDGSGSDSHLCLVCLDAPRQHGFLHGGSMHIGVCGGCAELLRKRGELLCPVCREPVERMVAIFS